MIYLLNSVKSYNNKELNYDPLFTVPKYHEKANVVIELIHSASEENLKAVLKYPKSKEVEFVTGQVGMLYSGQVYKGLDFTNFTKHQRLRAIKQVRIIDPIYGVLKLSDKITHYRVDYNTSLVKLFEFNKTRTNQYKSFNEMWKEEYSEEFQNNNFDLIINCASDEYTNQIREIVSKERFIQIRFFEVVNGEKVVKSAFSKIARGKFVNKAIQLNCKSRDDLQKISFDGYIFSPSDSSVSEFVFIR